MLTGADVLVDALVRAGVDTVFALPGFQLDSLFDALARDGRIRVVTTRHEQATSYMADGYARASGKLGVCIVVPGPGLLNAMSGLATAYACNSRVLCIAGQGPSELIDRGLGLVHEVPGQLEMARAVAKWSVRATSAGEVGRAVAEALTRIDEGRPRPAVLEVPMDVLAADGSDAGVAPPVAPERPEPDQQLIARAAELLAAAARPLIIAGGGVLAGAAWDSLRTAAETYRAPVVMTPNGKGAIDAAHPLAFECGATQALLAEADVVLAVGTRLAQAGGARRRLKPGQRLVRVDVDAEELQRMVDPEIAIEADAKQGLEQLASAADGSRVRSSWPDLENRRKRSMDAVEAVQPQAAYGAVLRDVLPNDTIVVAGMTQVGYWMRLGYPVRTPRTWVTPGYQATLGFELPTGLGAQVACPDRRVVIVAGDGGFMFNAQELATAALHEIGAITVVFNDGAYGNVRRTQRDQFEGRVIASELRNPDFQLLAQSFGIRAWRAEGPGGLRTALGEALRNDRPGLVEVPVGEMADPWPLLMRA